ncbi:MAG TPA: Ig-like domain-containing protein, partial [Fimbriimonadaceae bacterium]|nr:Ig-like domain-containing protein [Fimbriimonadaceae bacterium]
MLKELVSQAPVGRLMKGLLLPALSLVGFIASAQSPTVHWTHTVQPERWYRSVNPLTYHAEGADPLTCQEIVDGTARETAQTHDGEIPVGGWGQGWHVFGVRATNASGHAVTPPWRGGWDETPGTAILLPEGAQTGIWNRPDARVVVRLDDQHSGARRFRYRWDNGEFSQWFINPNPPRNDGTKRPPFAGQIPLLPGTHVLVVQVEDETFTGAEMLGNRESYSLGEFKMDAVRPVVTAMSFDPPSPSAAEHITVSVEATDEGSGVHHIDLFRNDMRIGTVNAASGQVVWNTAGLPGGEYHIRSVAFDRAGNASEPRIAPYVLNRGGGGTPVLAGLQIRPAEVVGGYTTTGTVGLTAPAGEGGAVITITDNSTAVQTPETVTIPAGAHVKSFTIGTSAVVELTRRNVTATYEGVSRTAVITLLPAGLYSFTIQPAEVFGGQHTTGTLRLSRPAGEGGVVVAISDNSSAILT